MAQALNAPIQDDWSGEDVTIAQIERELARLRYESAREGAQPNLRTSVMTHIAWVPPAWQHQAEETLAGMAERHPSRTLLLVPRPDEPDGLDALVSLRCFPIGDRAICGEVVELTLRGERAHAPASIVLPLLISDLPVFMRWRGEPWWDSGELEQLLGIVDRLVVDSTEWEGLPAPYARLAEWFDRVAVSDIAWDRTERWRSLLASLWPEIASVRELRVHGTAAQGHLLAGWLRARLGHDVRLELDEQERLEGIDLDGRPAPFPPGRPPNASDVLSAQLDRFGRDGVYEAAVRAATGA
ncbi:MAG TPA: glucose-6-phosphate dehydrogenase assembly protein OpcA [Gaiellaceae bacterium]|nr:glucose-6-phosphate dehydrogenase assembly protein OpcA [Gaiellaceae bacterium]